MALLYDFSNFIMQAAIFPPGQDGTPIPLWANTQFKDAALSLAVLTELTVELGLGMIPKMTATLEFNYLDALQFLNTSIVVQGVSLLSAQFGYATGNQLSLSPPFTALILEPDVSISSNGTTVTLVAQGVDTGRNRQGKAGGFVGTREQLLKHLLPNAEVDVSEVVAAGGEAGKLLREPVSFVGGWGSDWFNVLRVVRDARCWLVVGRKIEDAPEGAAFTDLKTSTHKDVIRLIPIDKRLGAAPRYAFQMFPDSTQVRTAKGQMSSGLGPGTGVFPILAFNRPSTSLFLPNATRGLVHKGIDDKTGVPYTKIYDDKDKEGAAPMPRTGTGDAVGVADDPRFPEGDKTTGDGMEPHFSDQADKQAKDKAHGEVKEKGWRVGIPVEVDTLGIPDLLPGEVVKIQGLGIRYDGNYVIHELTHTFGVGGFTTRFKAFTNTSENSAVLKEAGLDAKKAFGMVNQLELEAAEKQDSVNKEANPKAGS